MNNWEGNGRQEEEGDMVITMTKKGMNRIIFLIW